MDYTYSFRRYIGLCFRLNEASILFQEVQSYCEKNQSRFPFVSITLSNLSMLIQRIIDVRKVELVESGVFGMDPGVSGFGFVESDISDEEVDTSGVETDAVRVDTDASGVESDTRVIMMKRSSTKVVEFIMNSMCLIYHFFSPVQPILIVSLSWFGCQCGDVREVYSLV